MGFLDDMGFLLMSKSENLGRRSGKPDRESSQNILQTRA